MIPTHNKPRRRGWLMSVLPATAWETLFLLVPFLAIVAISFLSRGEYGEWGLPFTLENYKQLAGFGLFGFEPLYPIVLARSVLFAFATAALSALAAVPLAFFIASLAGRRRFIALTLLTIPIWTNLLVRTYAWQVLLAPDGYISRVTSFLGITSPGEALYPSTIAVLLCLVCDYLPFAALPLYASVEKLDHGLVEAARDLGASGWNLFRHGIYPQIKPGLVAGIIFVFLPALGQFVVPDLLGGAKTVLLGNVLQQQFGPSRDWPFGAAVATVTMLFIAAGVLLYSRMAGKEPELV